MTKLKVQVVWTWLTVTIVLLLLDLFLGFGKISSAQAPKEIDVGQGSLVLAIDQSNDRVVVSNLERREVTLLDISTQKLSTPISLGRASSLADSIAVNPMQKWIYVPEVNHNRISVFNFNRTPAFRLESISQPKGVSYDLINDQLYVASGTGLAVFSEFRLTPITFTVMSGVPFHVAVNSTTKTAYVSTNTPSRLYKIDLNGQSEQLAHSDIVQAAVHHGYNRLFALRPALKQLVVISGESDSMIGEPIVLDDMPMSAPFVDEASDCVYIASGKLIYIIDASELKIRSRVILRDQLSAVVVHFKTGEVFAAARTTGKVFHFVDTECHESENFPTQDPVSTSTPIPTNATVTATQQATPSSATSTTTTSTETAAAHTPTSTAATTPSHTPSRTPTLTQTPEPSPVILPYLARNLTDKFRDRIQLRPRLVRDGQADKLATCNDAYFSISNESIVKYTNGVQSVILPTDRNRDITDIAVSRDCNTIFFSTWGSGVWRKVGSGSASSMKLLTGVSTWVGVPALLLTDSSLFAGTASVGSSLGSVHEFQIAQAAWRTRGPSKMDISSLLAEAGDTDDLFIGSADGVWKLRSDGGDWIQYGFGLNDQRVIALAPDSRGYPIYAGLRANGLFKYDTNSFQWSRIGDIPSTAWITSISTVPRAFGEDGVTRVLGTHDSGIWYQYRESPEGWIQSRGGEPLTIRDVASHSGNLLIAASDGVWSIP